MLEYFLNKVNKFIEKVINKVKRKKRIIFILIFTIIIAILLAFKFFLNEKKENIYFYSFTSYIYDNEINLENFSKFQQADYWTQHSGYKRFESFDFSKTDNLGQIFDFCYCIGFDKSLNGKVKEVASELEIPEEAKENLMYYSIDDEPFEGYRVKENGDGTYLIYVCGATRKKNFDEIKTLIQGITIHLYIQYEDGTIETKPMKVKRSQIELESTINNVDSILIEKETDE